MQNEYCEVHFHLRNIKDYKHIEYTQKGASSQLEVDQNTDVVAVDPWLLNAVFSIDLIVRLKCAYLHCCQDENL